MLDTTLDMQEKQLEIIFSKSASERALMGMDMTEFAYRVVRNSVIAQNENFTEREIAAEIFRRYYQNDFSKEDLARIVEAILKA